MAFFDTAPPAKKQRCDVDESIPALPTELWLMIAEFLPASALPAFQAVSVAHWQLVKRYHDRLRKYEACGFWMNRYHGGLEILGHFEAHDCMDTKHWSLTFGEDEVRVERSVRRNGSQEVKHTSTVSFAHLNIRQSFEPILNSVFDKVESSVELSMMNLPPSDVDLLSLVIHRVDDLVVRDFQNDSLARLPSLFTTSTPSHIEITVTDKSKVPEDLFSAFDISKLEKLEVRLEEEAVYSEEEVHGEVGPIALNVTDDWLFRFAGWNLRLSDYSTTLISTQTVNTILKELQSGQRKVGVCDWRRYPFICDAVDEAVDLVFADMSYEYMEEFDKFTFPTPTGIHYLFLDRKQQGYWNVQYSPR